MSDIFVLLRILREKMRNSLLQFTQITASATKNNF